MKKFILGLIFASSIASAPLLLAQDDGTTNTTSPAPSDGDGGYGQKAGKWKEAFAQLDLTDAQKAQIKQIRANTQPGKERRQQIMGVLTPEQKQKLIGMFKDYRSGQAAP
jgi:Spy/CpxP family protein refolding chaperone